MSQRTIWKYTCDVEDVVELHVPRDTTFIPGSARSTADGVFEIWAEVQVGATLQDTIFGTRRLNVYGTGQRIPAIQGQYLGTVFDRSFVWHIYESLIPWERV